MTEKQLSVLNRNLTSDNIEFLESEDLISDFINLIIQLKQPNRWSHYVKNVTDCDTVDYNTLIELKVYNLYKFLDLITGS